MKYLSWIVISLTVQFTWGQTTSAKILESIHTTNQEMGRSHTREIMNLNEASILTGLYERLDTLRYAQAFIDQKMVASDTSTLVVIERYYFENDSIKCLIFLNGDQVTGTFEYYRYEVDLSKLEKMHKRMKPIQASNYDKVQYLYHGCISPSKKTIQSVKEDRLKTIKSTYQICFHVNRVDDTYTVSLGKPPKKPKIDLKVEGGKF